MKGSILCCSDFSGLNFCGNISSNGLEYCGTSQTSQILVTRMPDSVDKDIS